MAFSSGRGVAALVVTCFLGYAALAWWGLGHYPLSGDEYSYALQAEIFAGGHLSVPAPPHPELYQVDHMLLQDRVRSKYPPGWPLLLALGTRLSAPWLVNAVLAAACLLLLHGFARRTFGPRSALPTVAIVGLSPFFALNAASFHSHPSTVLALAAFLWAFSWGLESGHRGWLFAAGAAIGYLSLIRPLEGIVATLALGVFVKERRRAVGLCILGGLPFAAIHMVYQTLQFGGPLTTGYKVFRRTVGEDRAPPPAGGVVWSGLQLLGTWLESGRQWLLPGSAALVLLGLVTIWRRRAKIWDGLPGHSSKTQLYLVVYALLHTAAYGAMRPDQGDAYGPRYLLPLLVPLGVWGGVGAIVALDWLRARAWGGLAYALVLGSLGWGLWFGTIEVVRAREERISRTSMFDAAKRLGLERVVVVIRPRLLWFARNGTTFDGPQLYIQDTGATVDELERTFPDRSVWLSSWSRRDERWVLTPAQGARGR